VTGRMVVKHKVSIVDYSVNGECGGIGIVRGKVGIVRGGKRE
jgi:hypothetical protein